VTGEHAVCVYGLWHLGCVTAACLASSGQRVIGLDPDPDRVSQLQAGQPPIAEPGLSELIQAGLHTGQLSFTAEPASALARASVVWVTFDTPVDDQDQADSAWVRSQVEILRPHVSPGTLVLVSSQVPVGFTRLLERDWMVIDPTLSFACSPENLRLGHAIETFVRPERVVIGTGRSVQKERLKRLFTPFSQRIEWMLLESAEMTKHALNGFLALSVVYANELARLCEQVGADAKEVERGLRSEPRIGNRAYLAPGAPLAGGTLARDVGFLRSLSVVHGVDAPLFEAIPRSNQVHQSWTQDRLLELIEGMPAPRVTLLGLTYKPGTDTLRRSSSLELAQWLVSRGASVAAFDPAIRRLPASMGGIQLASAVDEALDDADVAVLATPWPEFAELTAERVLSAMRNPQVIDQAGFLGHLGDDPRLTYVRVGRPRMGARSA
jgi:UDPglucose 6-dehydrogenase